eukprot:TRINITY_DN7418_c0_g1_i1.p1 TRINITY_DN7418_c0_g1~~TRINITY_DN7418_c0_g1_i1.p1  ORF type:complete len:176 (-),score=23.42 TRINITY_DN7418_c0_g1_i1:412-939(-)
MTTTSYRVELWPPKPSPAGVEPDDCTYEDTTADLPMIAQRAFNDDLRRRRENSLQLLWRRSLTASFIADFAHEVGAKTFGLTETEKAMLDDFMQRVEEWTAKVAGANPAKTSDLARIAQRALEGAVQLDEMRSRIKARWNNNWKTTEGTLLNVATIGLAAFAAYATVRSAGRGRR